jgi:hypothetical protein
MHEHPEIDDGTSTADERVSDIYITFEYVSDKRRVTARVRGTENAIKMANRLQAAQVIVMQTAPYDPGLYIAVLAGRLDRPVYYAGQRIS